MKSSDSFILVARIAVCTVICFSGCKKNSTTTATPKGCNDPEAVNYNTKATTDVDCIYPAAKLEGVWNVSEYESTGDTTIAYTATIMKVDTKTIHVKNNTDYPSPIPVYHADNMNMQIIWSTKSLGPNGIFSGYITDINSKWYISYTDSVSGSTYKVKQTYTR